MEMPESERPRAIGIVGWFSVFVAVYFLLTGAGGVLLAIHPQPPPGLSSEAVRTWMSRARFNGPTAALDLAIGFVMLVSSIWYLGLREIGRKTLEGLNWFGLAYTVVFTIWAMVSYPAALPSQERGSLIFVEVLTAAWAVIRLAVIGLIITALRSPEVRTAMRR